MKRRRYLCWKLQFGFGPNLVSLYYPYFRIPLSPIGLIHATAEVPSWSFDAKSYSWKNKSHRQHNKVQLSWSSHIFTQYVYSKSLPCTRQLQKQTNDTNQIRMFVRSQRPRRLWTDQVWQWVTGDISARWCRCTGLDWWGAVERCH